jgi:hypothetical protein
MTPFDRETIFTCLIGIGVGLLVTFGINSLVERGNCWQVYNLPCSSIPDSSHENYKFFIENAPSLLRGRVRY